MKKIVVSINGVAVLEGEYTGPVSWVGKYDAVYTHLGIVQFGISNVKKSDYITKKF
jgi:hypothetical protein